MSDKGYVKKLEARERELEKLLEASQGETIRLTAELSKKSEYLQACAATLFSEARPEIESLKKELSAANLLNSTLLALIRESSPLPVEQLKALIFRFTESLANRDLKEGEVVAVGDIRAVNHELRGRKTGSWALGEDNEEEEMEALGSRAPKPEDAQTTTNEKPPHDPVNHPSHYTHGKFEVIEVIEEFASEDYHVGNVLKYLLRWRFKGGIEDLKKAAWYLLRKIEFEEKKNGE